LFTTNPLDPAALDSLAATGAEFQIEGVDLDPSELLAALRGKEAYILGGVENVTEQTLAAAPDLKVVAFLGVGYRAFVDADAAARHGIAVTNAPGANAQAVAEFTVALMLDSVRRVTSLSNETKAGGWPVFRAANLEGRILGIVGMGTIGATVARIAIQGFGMSVVYCSRHQKPDVEQALGVRRLALPALLEEADVVSLHAAFGPDTAGILDAAALARLRPDAVVVNTSEAELIEPHALHDALAEGRIGCVAMDGYYIEPVPAPADDPYGLLCLPDDRFLLTPHTAFFTRESFTRTLATNLRSIENVLSTGTDERVVNPAFAASASWLRSGSGVAPRADASLVSHVPTVSDRLQSNVAPAVP
jgi:gluconate 2-dehydrogenase